MSAELVDPFATPPPERLKAADMCEDITARLLTSQRDDPPLYPQIVQHTLRQLKRAADDPHLPLAVWARLLLEALHHRAVSGVEYGEPQEPAWSLDPEERHTRPADDPAPIPTCNGRDCGGRPHE